MVTLVVSYNSKVAVSFGRCLACSLSVNLGEVKGGIANP